VGVTVDIYIKFSEINPQSLVSDKIRKAKNQVCRPTSTPKEAQ
jgi:hypothetical protein